MNQEQLDLYFSLGRRRAIRLWPVKSSRARKPFFTLARWETELLLAKRRGRLLFW